MKLQYFRCRHECFAVRPSRCEQGLLTTLFNPRPDYAKQPEAYEPEAATSAQTLVLDFVVNL